MERERRGLVGHIAQAKADGHAVEGVVLERQALRVRHDALHIAHESRIEQAVAADLEHGRIDVREHHSARLADLPQQPRRQITGPAGDVQSALTRPQAGQRQREVFPQPMRAEGHQIVHDVVLARDRGKYGVHARGLVGRRDLFEAKITVGSESAMAALLQVQAPIVADSEQSPASSGYQRS